ncbi:hypothetical protein BVY04_03265 [bacterium M21]|nr:hypothetical protein BVY04_03265 [bacterium M21]
MPLQNKIHVLLVDASDKRQQIFAAGFAEDSKIEVANTALHYHAAKDILIRLPPDVLLVNAETVDEEVLLLKKLSPSDPLPLIVLTSSPVEGRRELAKKLNYRPANFVQIRPGMTDEELIELLPEVCRLIRLAALAGSTSTSTSTSPTSTNTAPKVIPPVTASQGDRYQNWVIAVGASTGGPEAVQTLLTQFSEDCPPILVVLHMPKPFTGSYAQRLDHYCKIEVKEAEEGDALIPGRALIAAGDCHLTVGKMGKRYIAHSQGSELVGGHCPSVDVLMHSVAKRIGRKAIGVILTGMGHDGTQGLLAMKQVGAHTIGQSKEGCMVYGMPKSAMEAEATLEMIPLDRIVSRIVQLIDSSDD